MAEAAPTQEYINELVKFFESDTAYAARNQRLEEQRLRRFFKKRPYVPAEYRLTSYEHRSAYMFDIARRGAGLTSTVMPEPKVIPYKLGSKAKENATLRERWLKAAYRKMNESKQVYYKIIDAFLNDGCAVWKVVTDEHLWANPAKNDGETDEEYNDRVLDHKRKSFPFFWEHVPVSTFYHMNDEDGLSKVVLITRESAANMAMRYGISKDEHGNWIKGTKGMLPMGECKRVEFWSRTHFAYMIDDFLVRRPGRHNYKRPPFFIAPFTLTSSTEADEEFFSLIYPMMHAQDTYDTLMTAKVNYGMLHAYPYTGLEPLGDIAIPIEPENTTVKLTRGETFVPPPGWRLNFITPPGTGQDMNHVLQQLKETIDQVGLAPILFGSMPSDTSSAAANTMIAVAKSIFSPGLANLAISFDEMASFMLRMVEELDKDGVGIPVFERNNDKGGNDGEWIVLKASDVDGWYEVTHTMNPVLPAEQQTKYMYLADAQVRGLVDKDYVREEGMAIHNPEEMGHKVWLEKAAESQEVNDIIIREALAPWRDMNAQAGGMPGMPGQGAAPPPNMPVSAGGPGAQVIGGMNANLPNSNRVASRPQGMGRG